MLLNSFWSCRDKAGLMMTCVWQVTVMLVEAALHPMEAGSHYVSDQLDHYFEAARGTGYYELGVLVARMSPPRGAIRKSG